MPSRDQILETIDAVIAARRNGDANAIHDRLAEGAQYRMAGAATLGGMVPADACCARMAVSGLIDLFEFHEAERLETLVEGNVAAVHWRIRASRPGAAAVDSELFDLWTFDEDGKIASVVEFGDTALMAQLLA